MIRRSGFAATLAFLIYAALAVLFFCHGADFTTKYLGLGSDPFLIMWYLNWWPFAVTHHINPFFSHFVWAPNGINIVAATSLPLAALLMAPVTLLAGAAFSYNLLNITAPVFAAWAGFLLAMELTDDIPASLVGGYLFGFSAYESGQILGHLNLDMIVFVPLAILLCVKRQRNLISKRRFIFGLALMLVCQISISSEIFAPFSVLSVLVWSIFLLCAPRRERAPWWRLAGEVVLANGLTALIVSPYLIDLATGLTKLQPFPNARFYVEPLSLVVPTPTTWLLHKPFAAVSARFNGNLAEQGAYMGWPLLAIMALCVIGETGKPYRRALFITILAIAVLSFGPALDLPGGISQVSMPWAIMLHLPLIGLALPVRLSIYVALGSAMAVGLWLSNGPRKWKLLKYTLAAAACIALIPNPAAHSWTELPNDPFFTPLSVGKTFGLGKNVLILPFAYTGPDMYWQVASGMRFIQTAGYTGFAPKAEIGWHIQDELGEGIPGPDFSNEMQSYCDVHREDFVLLGPGTKPAIRNAFAKLGWQQMPAHSDVQSYRVPSPNQMHYRYITGDYFPADSWIGRTVTIYTRNEPLTLTLSEAPGPIRNVRLVVTGPAAPHTYIFKDPSAQHIQIPADAKTTLSTGDVFIADPLFHNGDMRQIALRISF